MSRSRPADMLAGLIAAAVALGSAEFAAGFIGGTSLIIEVGDAIIVHIPGPTVTAIIASLGSSAKPLLLTGVIVGALLVGALLGPIAGRWKLTAAVAFATFTVIGAVAAASDPLTDTASGVFSALVGSAAGYYALGLLLDAAAPSVPRQSGQVPGRGVVDRRRFLTVAATASGGAALLALTGRSLLGPRVDVEAQRAAITLPPIGVFVGSDEYEIEGLSPLITPNRDFYRIDTALSVPRVDASSWRLTISGMVDRPFELTFDELLAMATLEQVITLACVSNEVGGDLVGTATWLGVPLADLLARAGVQAGATQVVGRSVDNFTVGFPTEVALDGRAAMVAIGMNGVPLPHVHGFPARLVVPGLFGYVSATKWLKEIELNTLEGYDAYWIPRGWSRQAPIKTQSRVDTPRDGRTIDPGPRVIAGVAWGGIRGIERVEVRVAGERQGAAGAWLEAELGESLSRSTWRQWVYRWDAEPGEYQIAVRATDGAGVTQTVERHAPSPGGATGHHTISVAVRDA